MIINLQDKYVVHKWFVWRPIVTDNKLVWLRFVWRRRINWSGGGYWEYDLAPTKVKPNKELGVNSYERLYTRTIRHTGRTWSVE